MKPAPPIARRTPVRVVLALLLATAFAGLTIAPAQAVSYRYWGFYQLTDGKWAFAQKGSDQVTPADGSVEGWRFAVGDASASRLPRAVADFGQICARTPAQQGKKRVGLVIDYGRAADNADPAKGAEAPAPKAVCAVVAADSSSTEVLKAAAELRTEKGLVCAVDGYPAAGCGAEVKDQDLTPAAKAGDKAITLPVPGAADASSSPVAPTSTTPSAGGSATSSAPAPPAAGGSATTTTADTDTTSADASPPTAAASSGSSVGTTIAYVVAALALIALVVFLVLRARASRKSDV